MIRTIFFILTVVICLVPLSHAETRGYDIVMTGTIENNPIDAQEFELRGSFALKTGSAEGHISGFGYEFTLFPSGIYDKGFTTKTAPVGVGYTRVVFEKEQGVDFVFDYGPFIKVTEKTRGTVLENWIGYGDIGLALLPHCKDATLTECVPGKLSAGFRTGGISRNFLVPDLAIRNASVVITPRE